MRRQIKMAAAAAAAFSLMVAAPARAVEIGDFLTGGGGAQLPGSDVTVEGTDTTVPGTDTTVSGMDAGSTQAPAASSGQELNVVTCTDSQTGLSVARALVPDGYSVSSETTWCGPCQSPDYPAEVFIRAESPDGSIQLTYESPLEFVQCMNAQVNGITFLTHQDWTISTDYLMMMLTYMNAEQYCDYVADQCMQGATDVTYVSQTPVTQETLSMLQNESQTKLDAVNQLLSISDGIYADYAETTVAERTYRYYDSFGKRRILVVSTGVQALRLVESISSVGVETNITNLIWSIPYRYCLMVDEDKYQEGLSVFSSFCTNTTISDQFKQAMADLSRQITQAVMNARSTSISSQTSYVQDTFSSTLSSEDDTYSGMDAWDDAIMDRNDYTLSSGDSVKVDTSYDYVYELPDGNVYATNSALDEPAGGTLLYAN